MTVTIKYGDEFFYAEGEHDDVCKAIANGDPLDVFSYSVRYNSSRSDGRSYLRITFFGDPDWVAVEL